MGLFYPKMGDNVSKEGGAMSGSRNGKRDGRASTNYP